MSRTNVPGQGRSGENLPDRSIKDDLANAHEAAQVWEHQLRPMIDAASLLVFYVDSQFRYRLANGNHQLWFGQKPEEIRGRPVREVLGEAAWQVIKLYMERALRGEEVSFEQPVPDPSVGPRWTGACFTPDRDSTGQVCGFFGVITRGSVEQESSSGAQGGEEPYRRLFESSREGIILVDMSGYITAANPALQRMLGRGLEELRNMTYLQLTPKRWHAMQERIIREQVLKRGYSDEYEKEYIRKDGRIVPISKRVWLLKNDWGQPVGMWGLIRDITEQKRAEQALRESEQRERARAEELRRLNQELESRVAQRTAEATQRAAQLQALAAELTNAEERERRRLAQILHDHLQQFLVGARMRAAIVSRRTSDPTVLREVSLLDELLHQAIQESRSLTAQLSPPILYDGGLGPALEWLSRWIEEKYDLKVVMDLGANAEPDRPEVRTLLFQAARELLLNVVKHSGASRAYLHLQGLDSGVIELSVKDEGRGFAADKATASTGGFGLFSIRQRLDLLGGSVRLDSRPGMGTHVSLVVPCGQARMASISPSPARAARDQRPDRSQSQPRIRVLLVDDQQILREGLGALLRDHADFDVVGEAADGEQAVQLAHSLRPDVVVMDASMPRLNGVESTRRLSRELPDSRVIALSMYSEDDMGAAMREAGAVAYLSKDGPVEKLVAEIRRAAALQRVGP
ncbi:MAG: PAS domain S-box protein [Acidobacteriota bacterium]